jgi:ATP adenylyltransferase
MKIRTASPHTRFGWIYDQAVQPDVEDWNTLVAENAHSVAMPSKGSLVAGWVLALPRRPILNLALLGASERAQLLEFCENLRKPIRRFASRVFEFEHGAVRTGSVVGCGVDQAHLHIVPLDFDLIEEAISQTSKAIVWKDCVTADPWSRVGAGEYIVVRDVDAHRAIVGKPSRPESQTVRKVIAAHLNLKGAWDYQKFPFREHVRETLKAFSAR